MKNSYTIGLVGNPNCGKTTLFNALTGARQRVGNWPGVTVEKKSGEYRFAGVRFEIVDLPGTYSLDAGEHDISLDEQIAREFVQNAYRHGADLIVNIVDAANLERNLYLTAQLAEMQAPLVVALNMTDVAEAKGMHVDAAALAAQLGCPVVPLVASEGQGIAELQQTIAQAVVAQPRPALRIAYPHALEQAIATLTNAIAAAMPDLPLAPRWLAVRLLEEDAQAQALAGAELSAFAQRLASETGEEVDIAIAQARYATAHRVAQAVTHPAAAPTSDWTERIDRIVLNRYFGIPIFLLMMYLMFMFTIKIGGAFIDFFDQAAGALFVDGVGAWLTGLGTPEWLVVLLAKGIGGGIQTVATFIPVIGFLYLFLSALEDSGYMARAAFVMDRFMRVIGLPGKSFVPLIVGFGCNVPAIMATRTLEHRRDRLMTIAMAPFMSCGARLPVYVLFAAAFFPANAQNVVFGLYLIGILVAVLTGLALKHSLFKGEPTPFIMELPPYHLPTLRGVILHAWQRLKGFVIKAGRIIVPMVLVINVLNNVGADGSLGNEDSDRSLLAATGRSIAPAFAPFGLSEENWPATVGIFTGILAKEVVVGTLNATYQALAESDRAAAGEEAPEEAAFDLGTALTAAAATIPEKLAEALGSWADPLGLAVGDLTDTQAAAEKAEVATAVFGAMAARFDGAAGAFAYLLFILLYTPCTAALAAIYQESGARWMFFVAGWTFALAYGTATLFYQAATFAAHPLSSTIWFGIVGAVLATAVLALRRYGRSREYRVMPIAPLAAAASCDGCSKAGRCGGH
ncbi:Fe(2+) transporter permease subunit FeoB [Sulfuricystis thermophila]|uniref:Fe(2+) transporter permease subunit FeoB n=1 Tax=Sulfuricystis thermophila TaxID=2496847 RepID=UPI0010365F0A|nr:Fe(2+) transporter permease subunit FeoB [Sulfuricystis thermophila]